MRRNRASNSDHIREDLRNLRPTTSTWAQSAGGTAVLENVLTQEALSATASERPHQPTRIGLRLSAVAMVLLAAALGPVALLGGEPDSPPGRVIAAPDETTKTKTMEAGRPVGYIFDSLPQLVANASVIVYGSVVSARAGEVLGDGVPSLRARDVEITVGEVFRGGEVPDRIVIHQGLYEGGIGIEDVEQPWIMPGDQVVAFLVPSEVADTHYTVVALPGVWTITESGKVSIAATDPVARKLDGVAWTTAQQWLRDAVTFAKENDIAPLPPGPGPSR